MVDDATHRTAGRTRTIRSFIAVLLLAVYAISASRGPGEEVSDVLATAYPAWHFVETGSWDLSGHKGVSNWFVSTEEGVRSNRSPGVIAVAVFGYALTSPFTDGFESWPATMIAIVTAWLGVLTIAAGAELLQKGLWTPVVVLFGLGTATWGVASGRLWPHGPAELAVAVALWFMIRGKDRPGGLALACAVIIRPPVALLAGALALVKYATDRSWKPLVNMGAPSMLAVMAYLIHNWVTFGSWSPLASYDAVGGLRGVTGLADWLGNVAQAFIGPSHGLFFWSAWILVCLIALPSVMKDGTPTWLRLTPLLAVAYILIHSAFEVASGGLPYNYRYPLEAVAFATPMLLLALPKALERSLGWAISVFAGAWAVFFQASFALLSECRVAESGLQFCSLFGQG